MGEGATALLVGDEPLFLSPVIFNVVVMLLY